MTQFLKPKKKKIIKIILITSILVYCKDSPLVFKYNFNLLTELRNWPKSGN